jgi:hypothetical protein
VIRRLCPREAQSRVGVSEIENSTRCALIYVVGMFCCALDAIDPPMVRLHRRTSFSVPGPCCLCCTISGHCLVRVSCEKPRSVPMPSHLGSVDVRGWVQSSFELLRDWWVKGETSAECTIYHDSLAQGHERPGVPFRIELDGYYCCLMTYTI